MSTDEHCTPPHHTHTHTTYGTLCYVIVTWQSSLFALLTRKRDRRRRFKHCYRRLRLLVVVVVVYQWRTGCEWEQRWDYFNRYQRRTHTQTYVVSRHLAPRTREPSVLGFRLPRARVKLNGGFVCNKRAFSTLLAPLAPLPSSTTLMQVSANQQQIVRECECARVVCMHQFVAAMCERRLRALTANKHNKRNKPRKAKVT